jgi:hypothetical protein
LRFSILVFGVCAIFAFARGRLAQLDGYSFALVRLQTRILNQRMLRISFLLFAAVLNCSATALVAPACLAGEAPALQTSAAKAPVDQLIPWLLDEEQQLRGIPFAEVIFDATRKRVLPVDRNNETDRRVIKQIRAACDETMKRMNATNSVIQNIARINEVSSHFEDNLRQLLSSTSGLSCDSPPTIEGKMQRSGYPDLRIVDRASGRVFYLDPKLYAVGSRDSSFRTFYFEPKVATNKVRDDAVHFIVGFEHERREKNERWTFMRWDLVDLSYFKVKLKAEFQGSNRDIYRPEAIVATGRSD